LTYRWERGALARSFPILASAVTKHSARTSAGNGHRKPIALVDDDPSVRRALARLLGTMDFGVSAFCSAEEFLAQAKPGAYASLILDIGLPGMSGLELYSLLAARGNDIPIIFISAAPEALREAASRTGGCGRVLCKPVDPGLLAEAVTQAQQPSHATKA
jgi:FixJ family two-component response regulator